MTTPHWTDRLNALIAEADEAAAGGDLAQVLAVVERLRGFISESPDAAAGVSELDRAARRHAEQLLSGAIAASLRDLATRSAAHEQLAGQLDAAAADSQKVAANLRLEPLRHGAAIVQDVLKPVIE